MPHARVNGINLYYEQEGSGPPLVLLSGITADFHFWDLTRRDLAKHHSLVMIDNRGAGQSEAPDLPYTLEQMAQDVIGLLDHLKIHLADIAGHSMGGAIVQILGHQFPQRFRRLVIAQSPSQLSPITRLALEQVLELRRRKTDVELLARGVLPWLFSNHFLADPKHIAGFVNNAVNNPHPPSYLGHLHQFQALQQFNSTEWLHQISLPTLVIAGEEDLLCPLPHVKAIADQIPCSHFVTFPHTGHMGPIEHPLKFVHTLDRFLNG